MDDSQFHGNAGEATLLTGAHYATERLASGSERLSKLRTKYLRISVQIYDNAICVLNILYIWCTRSGNFGQINKCSVDLLIWWDIGKCKVRQTLHHKSYIY